jgi:hypothetical protein
MLHTSYKEMSLHPSLGARGNEFFNSLQEVLRLCVWEPEVPYVDCTVRYGQHNCTHERECMAACRNKTQSRCTAHPKPICRPVCRECPYNGADDIDTLTLASGGSDAQILRMYMLHLTLLQVHARQRGIVIRVLAVRTTDPHDNIAMVRHACREGARDV